MIDLVRNIRIHQLLIAGLTSAVVFLSGCGNVNGTITAIFDRTSGRDFKKSEIISNGSAVANGQSQLLVVIQLMNSDNSAISDFKPTYEVVSGSGVTASACTTSNINGVSTCVLKAVQPGTKRISVTNLTISLQADVVFTQPLANQPHFALASTSGKRTQGSVTLNATVGNIETHAAQTSGNYTLYGGMQGEVFSR